MTTEEEHNVNGSLMHGADTECLKSGNNYYENAKHESNAFSLQNGLTVDTHQNDSTLNNNNNNSSSASRTVGKLRIIIPPMASPSSYYSSSSESNSPVRTKKVRKRYCDKCEIRFKHTAELLTHLKIHVTLPKIELTAIDAGNPFYSDFLRREEALRKRKASTELNTGALKIRLKVPSNNEGGTSDTDDWFDRQRQEINGQAATKTQSKEGTIRILTAQEIKLSPPRMVQQLPSDAMVSLGNPFDNNSEPRHFECPPLDGLSQFMDETVNNETTEQLLRKLLENSEAMPESNSFDAPSNEFISIENLAHMCSMCKSSFPNANLLREHARQTGHNFRSNAMSILEPIQEMIVEPLLPIRQPPISPRQQLQQQQQQQQQHEQQQQHQRHQHQQHLQMQLQHQHQHQHQQHQQQMRQMHFGPPSMQVGSYGQPPVLPIDQMTNQVRNFSNGPPPPLSQAQRFGQMSFPPLRRPSPPPPLYRPNNSAPNHNHAQMPNQPMNMAPFMQMSPDMYNPRPTNQPLSPNMSHSNPFGNSQLANRLMAPMPMLTSRLRSCLSMPPQQMMPPRPNFQRPFSQPPRPAPLQNNFSPPLDNSNARSSPQRHNVTHLAARIESQRSKENNRHSPIISMAPPAAGLPIIHSVQGGASVTANEPNRGFQLSNQITLSVKPKESTSANAETTAASNAVNILANRGILIKPTNKQIEMANTNSNSNNNLDAQKSTKCGTAEEAVHKLKLNNSVSIISKKKSPHTEPTTIDLSNDEDRVSQNVIRKPSPMLPIGKKSTIKCPVKSCNARFVSVDVLRAHTRGEHRLTQRAMKCAVCSAEFPSSLDLRLHHLQEHQKSQLGIPVVDLRKARTCHKLLALGITSFIPIQNYSRHSENADLSLALPIITINGSSKNSLVNLLGADELSMLPVNRIRQIPKPASQLQRTPERTVQRTSETIQPNTSNLSKKPT